jgi:hypothetical protein
MEDIELGYRLETSGSRMIFAPEAKAVHYRFPTYEDFVDRSEQAGYSLGQLIRLHPELKKRFVESGRITKRLKNLHVLYKWAAGAIDPVFKRVTNWEKSRGTVPVTRFMDVHYNWSIRYHFFLGYHRYSKEYQRHAQNQMATPIQPALAKKFQVKAKGEL